MTLGIQTHHRYFYGRVGYSNMFYAIHEDVNSSGGIGTLPFCYLHRPISQTPWIPGLLQIRVLNTI
jgi:hypothetical protein